jgi:hypothetical protein
VLAARKLLQIVRLAMLLSIVIYAILVKQLPATAHANPLVYRILTLVAIGVLCSLLLLRRKLVKPSEDALANTPEDAVAIRRWQSGYLMTYAFSEAIALYGVVLHFMGFTLAQVAPFLIAGFVLILFYSPRLPARAA